MRSYTFRLIVIALGAVMINSCSSKKVTLKYDQILGYWKTLVGENEYVQFEKLDSEYVYSAFTYSRLAASGIWEIEENNLLINFDDGSSTSVSVSFKGDTLVFNEGSEKYTRAIISGDGKTPLAEIGDVEVLEAIIKNVNIIFSEIEPFKEDWVTQTINWQKITTEVVLITDALSEMVEVGNQISKYLVSQGFNLDSTRTTEVVTGYQKEKLFVMIRLRGLNEPSIGDTCYIDVISGIEKKVTIQQQ